MCTLTGEFGSKSYGEAIKNRYSACAYRSAKANQKGRARATS